MLFDLKNAGATYMRVMTTIFNDMNYNEIEVYVDDVMIKSNQSSYLLIHLEKFFDMLSMYNVKLNPTKCALGVPPRKLIRFIVSKRGVDLDPSKMNNIQVFPPPKT